MRTCEGRHGHPALPACLLLLVVASAAGAQRGAPPPSGPILSHAHWSYDFLDALDLLGGASAWMTTVRTQPRGAVIAEATRAEGFALGTDPRLGPVRRGWRRQLLIEDSPGYLEGGVRAGDAFLDPGAGAYAGLRLERAWAGGRIASWAEGQWGAYQRFDGLRSGGISAPIGAFTVSAMREPLRAATPAAGNVLLGGEIPMDLLHLANHRPLRLPIVERLFGPGEGHVAIGPFGGLSNPGQGWIALASLRGRPHDRFRIGAARSLHVGRSTAVDSFGGAPITAARVLRSLAFVQNRPHDWDDQKAEISFEFRLAPGGRPLAPYVVLSQEDSPLYQDPGIHVGMRTAGVGRHGLWMLRYDYVGIGERGRWCRFCDRVTFESGGGLSERGREQGTWYRHGRIGWPFERAGLPLGEALGGYGSRHRLDAWFWPAGAGYRVRGWLFEERREPLNLLHGRWPGIRRGLGMEGAILASTPEASNPRLLPPVDIIGSGIVATGGGETGRWSLSIGGRLRLGEPRADVRPAAAPEPLAEDRRRRLVAALDSLPADTHLEITSPALLGGLVRGTRAPSQPEPSTDRLALVAANRAPVLVPLAHVTRVRAAATPARATWYGLAIGTLAGFVLGVFADEETSPNLMEPRRPIRIAGTVAGAAAGTALGWRVPMTRWREVAF